MKDKQQIRFCLKAIVLWEALADRSYQRIDLQAEEDVQLLLYAMYLAGGGEAVSLDLFAESLLVSERVRHDLLKEAIRQISLQNALSPRADSTQAPMGDEEEEDNTPPSKLSPLIARIIVEGGVSAEYVMYQMGLWELPLYLKAMEEQRNEMMERERLWCYLGLSPHIDHKTVKSPKDLIKLPHERVALDAEAEIQDELYSILMGRGNTED